MTEKLEPKKDSKAAEIKAPSWLDRSGKRMFRQVVRQLPEPHRPLSDAQVDWIGDFVEARQRIGALNDMLARDIGEDSSFTVNKARIIALVRQIDPQQFCPTRLPRRLG